MMGKKIIKTREPGPEFQALASEWKPQVRRAWLVKPPPTTEVEVAPSTKSVLAHSTESAATTEVEVAPSTKSVLAHSTESAATTELEAAPSTKSVLGGSFVDPNRTAGWTKVPNDLLEKLMHLDLNQRGFRVMLLIVRQTLGFHRADIELSGTDIENATGIFRSHVPTVVRDLVARGYLEKTSGGGREKNSYKIGAALLSKHQVSVGSQHQLSARTSHQLGSGTNHKVGGTTESDSQNEIRDVHATLLESKKQKESFERNSLSHAPLEWRRYSDTLTVKARERADSIFEGLKQRFPDDDPNEIAACPDNLRAFGAPDGTPWMEIKSPHGLMESAWPQLRDFFRGKRESQRQAEVAMQARERERSALERRKVADDAALNEQADTARAAFAAACPDDAMQIVLLEKFCPHWVSNPLTEPGRSLAVDAWYRATQATSQDRENSHEQ